jgi:hypothetical protein
MTGGLIGPEEGGIRPQNTSGGGARRLGRGLREVAGLLEEAEAGVGRKDVPRGRDQLMLKGLRGGGKAASIGSLFHRQSELLKLESWPRVLGFEGTQGLLSLLKFPFLNL